MWSFLISIAVLILGYFTYGALVERLFGPDPQRKTPAMLMKDGVDYIPLPSWRVFMIQFLNIAGTGPIFGAIMGAKFGPACFLWIVFGNILGGAVHDYILGMLSIRNKGAVLPELVGMYLGKHMKNAVLIFSVILLLLVGAVFVYSPALILGSSIPVASDTHGSIMVWIAVIFAYYIIATLVPIDKIMGKIYPIFAAALLFMGAALFVCLLVKWPSIPEFWDGLHNRGDAAGMSGQPIFPYLFVTVACGAISGFHATQSPIMARCMQNEKLGRSIFYGSMVTEGIVALIWAAVSSYFFFDGGMQEVGALSGQAPEVVTKVCNNWLGVVGGILAVLGVVAAPVTTGDTAFRSARIILADFLHYDQAPKLNRLYVSIPIFLIASLLLWFNVANADGFNIIWRYFGWANQTLACVALWVAVVFMLKERPGKAYIIPLIPAVFMNAVCLSYICVDKAGLNLPVSWAPSIAISFAFSSLIAFFTLKSFGSKDS